MDSAQHGADRPGARERGARCRARRPRTRQGAHPRVPGRAAAEPARHGRGDLPLGPARRGQDLAGAVHGPRVGARVREAVLRRAARRDGPARPQPHLARRAARLDPARDAAGGQQRPGVRTRRDRQARPRPRRGPARGARPGTESLFPRRVRRAAVRPLRGAVHHDGERGGADPAGAAGPARDHRPARLHRGREGRHRRDAPDPGTEPGRRADGRAGAVHPGRLSSHDSRLHTRAGDPSAHPLPADRLPQGGPGAGDRQRVAGPRVRHGGAGAHASRRAGCRPHRRSRPAPRTGRRARYAGRRAGAGAGGSRAAGRVAADRSRACETARVPAAPGEPAVDEAHRRAARSRARQGGPRRRACRTRRG